MVSPIKFHGFLMKFPYKIPLLTTNLAIIYMIHCMSCQALDPAFARTHDAWQSRVFGAAALLRKATALLAI